MDKTLCIYHDNCFDGFAAAWVVRRALGDKADFYAATHGKPPPDLSNYDSLIIVDFSYPRKVMVDILGRVGTVTILDHHKTAREDLHGLNADVLIFDMERSGAGIAWGHFFPHSPRVPLISYIEDRDLYRRSLPGWREVHEALASYPFDFETWDALMERQIWTLRAEGEALVRKLDRDIAQYRKVLERRMLIAGHMVPVLNVPFTHVTEVGNAVLAADPDAPFVACYWDTPDGRVFGLRSTDERVDVSEIAKRYGGGGHRNASGFTVPHGWAGGKFS